MPTVDFRNEIYTDVRQYLIGLFDCPVTKARQNKSPLPHDGITMLIMFDTDLDWTVTEHEDQSAQAQTSVRTNMQLDFFGELAGARARQLCTLWRSIHATERLNFCQPLYANDPMNLEYVNEQKEYEQRYMLEIALQYNPYYTYNQEAGTQVPSVEIRNPAQGD